MSPSTYPTITPVSTETSELTGLPLPPQPLNAVAEDPQVSIGIFPASHIHARDELPDAEGRLADVYRRILSGHDPVINTLQRDRFASTMETLPEEEETSLGLDLHLDLDSPRTRGHKSKPPESGKSNGSAEQPPDADPADLKPPPPRPSLKSGDDTFSGSTQPLIDEIASALREWYTLMFVYLSRRDYALFNTVKDHIEALHLSRRQMLTQTLSADEAINLRKECVTRLVRGNIVQGLDVIVRHPAWGGLVTVDVEGDARSRNWVSAIRMYAMQAALAYIDVSPTDSTSLPRSSALGNVAELLTSAHTQQPAIARAAITRAAASAKFYHVYLELKAFVASPCAPGETSELYFSLYNKADGRFLTEDFCAVLNHNGVLARETPDNDKMSLARTLFIELSHHDIQEPLYLVCKIVRKGAMKLGNAFGMKQSNNARRGSEPAIQSDTASIRGWNDDLVQHQPNGDANPANLFRRPFACAVLELSQLAKMATDKTDTSAHEYALPIFVPLEEAMFSTLHQSIIASKVKEFEKSSR